jgi:hypothetical protein
MFQDFAEKQNIDACGRKRQFKFLNVSIDDRIKPGFGLCGRALAEFHAAAPPTFACSQRVSAGAPFPAANFEQPCGQVRGEIIDEAPADTGKIRCRFSGVGF